MARRPTAQEWSVLRSWFPYLPQQSVWVLGGATARYNCLAWALGRTDRWVWPWSGNPSLATFTAFLRNHGYAAGTPAAAAAYGTPAWGSYAIGHIGRFWVGAPSSKLGSYLLIQHSWAGLNYGVYGNVRQYYRRVAQLEERASMDSIDMVEPEESALPALSQGETEELDRLAANVPSDARAAFEAAYAAWRRTWSEPPGVLDSTGVALRLSASFVQVVAASRDAVPLLMTKLADPEEFHALQVAERVLEQPQAVYTLDLDDPDVLEGEQYRARLTVASWLASQ